ncbi:unnamed protein product [Sphagnum troendelagicum]|uniref:Uncharacterized protein n=1 Tax=Sphagnum troendelagicum TaxID=128251 RepID=A0ABP0UMJ3_9BRYO
MTSEEFRNRISGMLTCGIDQRTICFQFWHFLQWSHLLTSMLRTYVMRRYNWQIPEVMKSCYLMASIEDKHRHFICRDEPDTAWALFYSFAE